jgi:hypothetical protein
MASLPRRRIKRTRDRNGRLSQPFRTRLALALGDDRGRRLAFAHEASTQAQAGDNQCNCQCELFHVTPLALNGSCRAIALVQPDKSLTRGNRTSAEKPQWICVFEETPFGPGEAPDRMNPVIRRSMGEIDRRRAWHGQHGRMRQPFQPAQCGNPPREPGDGQRSDQSRRQLGSDRS